MTVSDVNSRADVLPSYVRKVASICPKKIASLYYKQALKHIYGPPESLENSDH